MISTEGATRSPRRGSARGRIFALAVVLAAVPVEQAEGQDVVGQAVTDARSELTAQVAAYWGMPVESVRVELPNDAPTVVDSVSVDAGSGDRWIATFVADGFAVRRFVRVGYTQEVALAATDLPRDHVVDLEDVAMGTRVVWGSPSPAPPVPEGWVAHRPITAGEALVEPGVRPPLMVRGGDEVEAVFNRNGVVLNIRAEALSSARSGEPVSVRMPSGKRMDGRVVGPGRVVLNTGVIR